MSERWGTKVAQRFFTLSCPLLLELGAIAYWSLAPTAHPQAMLREIEGVTQCVVVLQDGRLRVAKAEGRPPGIEGSVFRYRVEDGSPGARSGAAAARLGTALKAVRTARGLSQSALARLAGVSPSAISQAERGQRGLSLDTLLDLSAKLSMTLDELLRGDVVPGYRTRPARRPLDRERRRAPPSPRRPAGGAPRVCPQARSRASRRRRASSTRAWSSSRSRPGSSRCASRAASPSCAAGRRCSRSSSRIEGWRNLSDREALVFWILRDERVPSRSDERLGRRRARGGSRAPRRRPGSPRGARASPARPRRRRLRRAGGRRSGRARRSTRRSRPRAPPGRAAAGRERRRQPLLLLPSSPRARPRSSRSARRRTRASCNVL